MRRAKCKAMRPVWSFERTVNLCVWCCRVCSNRLLKKKLASRSKKRLEFGTSRRVCCWTLSSSGRRSAFVVYVLACIMVVGRALEDSNLVDSASSHTLVSKIKPCMSKYNSFTLKTANGSLYQL